MLVAKKDYYAAKHMEIDVPNLEVIKALQSLTSRGLVKTQFSWQYYYYTLTEEGIQYLRDFLHLPAEIVPATYKKSARPTVRPGAQAEGGRRAPRGEEGEYRRRVGGDAKKESAPGGFKPEFRGGAGRGAPRS